MTPTEHTYIFPKDELTLLDDYVLSVYGSFWKAYQRLWHQYTSPAVPKDGVDMVKFKAYLHHLKRIK